MGRGASWEGRQNEVREQMWGWDEERVPESRKSKFKTEEVKEFSVIGGVTGVKGFFMMGTWVQWNGGEGHWNPGTSAWAKGQSRTWTV